MLPKLSIVRSRRNFSHVSESFYDASRLITCNASINKDDILGAAVLETGLAHVHETTHWFQHVGTSSGLFLDFLRHSRSAVFMSLARDLPAAFKRKLVERRFSKKRPVVRLNDRQYPVLAQGDPSLFQTMTQIWYDHLFLERILEDSTIVRDIGIAPLVSMAHVIADVALFACKDMEVISAAYASAGHGHARLWYFPAGDKLQLERFGSGRELTTCSLQECAATLAELTYLRESILHRLIPAQKSDDFFEKRFLSLRKTSYGYPLDLFLDTHGARASDDPYRAFQTLATIIFAALNPPLPPLLIGPQSSGNPWTWRQVYPPVRFLDLLRASKRMDLLPEHPDHAEIANFIETLAVAAGVDVSTISAKIERSTAGAAAVERAVAKYADDSNRFLSIHREIPLAANEKIGGWKSNLLLRTNLGAAFNGPHAHDFVEVACGGESYDFLRPPLLFGPSGQLQYHGSEEFGALVCASVVSSSLIMEFICGSGDFVDREMPPEVYADPDHWQTVLRNTVKEQMNLTSYR